MKRIVVLFILCSTTALAQYISGGNKGSIFDTPISGPLDFTQQAFDVQSYDVELDLTKAPATDVVGKCNIWLTWLQSPADNVFYFHLRDLKIDSAFYQGIKVTPVEVGLKTSATYHYEITPPPQLSTSSATVTIYYRGKMTSESEADGAYWGGVQSYNGVLYALGVGFHNNYVSSTQHWMPCYDHPSDKATFTGKFITAKDYTVASNVVMNINRSNPDKVVYEYSHNFPCATYLLTFACSKYVANEIKGGNIPMVAWSAPADTFTTKYAFSILPKAVVAFEKRFGPYPFEKVGFVNTPTGSMEHQTMVSMDAAYVVSRYSLRDSVNSIGYHELAHQWFGDMVTCRDFRSAWLNESFAKFCESIWQEELYGFNKYLIAQGSDASDYILNITKSEGILPLYDYSRVRPSSNYPRTIYEKGSVVLGMLRYELGESLFFGAIRKYLEKYKYSVATTEMLKQEFETFSSKDLAYYFDQWIYGKGYPVVRAVVNFHDNPDGKTKSVSVKLRQVQQDSWGVYKNLAIEVGFKKPDLTYEYHVFKMTDKENVFWLDSLTLPSQGSPNGWVNFNQGPSVRSLFDFQSSVVDVNDNDVKNTDVVIYPNPAENHINISYFKSSNNLIVSMYSASGIKLISDIIVVNSSGNCRLDVSKISSGVYYLVISDGITSYNKIITIIH